MGRKPNQLVPPHFGVVSPKLIPKRMDGELTIWSERPSVMILKIQPGNIQVGEGTPHFIEFPSLGDRKNPMTPLNDCGN